jgi:hypothetical protein
MGTGQGSDLRRRFIILAVFAALVAFVLAGCGSSGGSGGSTGSTATGNPGTSTSIGGSSTSSTAEASSSTPLSSTTPSGPPPCRAAGMSLSYLGQQGATGHGELGFALRNTTARRCHTIGYPGVLFLRRSGAALPTIPTRTTHDFFGTAAIASLVVAPHARVSFRLGVTHGITSSVGCTTAYALQVIPPNDTASLRIAIPMGGAYECRTVTVSPLRPGISAYP